MEFLIITRICLAVCVSAAGLAVGHATAAGCQLAPLSVRETMVNAVMSDDARTLVEGALQRCDKDGGFRIGFLHAYGAPRVSLLRNIAEAKSNMQGDDGMQTAAVALMKCVDAHKEFNATAPGSNLNGYLGHMINNAVSGLQMSMEMKMITNDELDRIISRIGEVALVIQQVHDAHTQAASGQAADGPPVSASSL